MSSTSARKAGSRRLRGCGRSTLISATMRPGLEREHQDAVAHQHRLLDVVRDHQDRADRHAPFAPEVEQVGAQGLGGQHVERRERLVHQQDRGLHDQRARQADALAHAARQLLRIGALEAVEADQVDGRQRPLAALVGGRRPAPRARARRSAARSARGTGRSSGTPWRRRGRAVAGQVAGPATVALGRPHQAGDERSSVDLPEPERPSRPTISFGVSVRSTSSSTSSSAPPPLP